MAAKKPITRVRIAQNELDKMSKEDLQKCWNLQDQYVDLMENKLQNNADQIELANLKDSEEKSKQQQVESNRKEHILLMRLATKEHEIQEFAGQIQELKQAQVPTLAQLRTALLDPAVNLLFERMKSEMDSLKARLNETQDELNAWKFTPDSNTGKRLMAKCRLLYQENEELGKIISSGRMAKLEGDLALQKSFSAELKKSQSELDEFLLELDEDVEGMQSTILYLQQQLREAKDQIALLQKEKDDISDTSTISLVNHSPEKMDTDTCPMPVIKSEPLESDMLKEEIKQTAEFNSILETPLYLKKLVKTDKLVPSSAICQSDGPKRTTTTEPSFNTLTSNSESLSDNSSEKKSRSVIVVNKNSLNHDNNRTDKQDNVESTNKGVDMRTKSRALKNEKTDNSHADQRSSDRIRKRNKPRTPEPPIKEENLPFRKRSRRKEIIDEPMERRTGVEIDTDMEVEVAQTLAALATAKNERTDVRNDADCPVGNGEIKKSN